MRPPKVARAAFHRLSPGSRSAVLRRLGYFAPWEDGFDLTPPALEPGERPGPPDFVGIGVQKAGTSWWYEMIVDHPGVYARPGIHKERHFFSHLGTEPFGPDEVGDYHGWFPRAGAALAGEWTPDYMVFPWVPALLAEAAPETRLLVLLRDPVERFRSGLEFRLRHGAPDDERTMAEAVRHGFYARGLRGYVDRFSTDRILVLQYERCVADPAGQLGATYEFLGLPRYQPRQLGTPVNPSGDKRVLDPDTVERLVELYADDVGELTRLVPTIDLTVWPNFRSVGR